jgi:hypothetical protein
MPANKGADSKQGLIITLVIFVLLSIILAVTTFYGFDGQNALLKEKQDAVSAKDTATKDRDSQKFQKALAKEYLGIADKEDKDTIGGLLAQYKEQPAFNNIANHEKMKAARWDNNQNKPSESMADLTTRLNTELNNMRADRDKALANLKRAREEYESQKNAQDAALKQAQTDLNKQQTANVELQQKKSQEYTDALDLMGKKDKEIEDLRKQLANTIDDKDKENRRIKTELAQTQTSLVKAQEKLPGVSVLDFDQPKGKIVRLNRSGAAAGAINPRVPFNPAAGAAQQQDQSIAYISLGTADNLKPGITFSIYGVTPTGKTNKVRKGSLEVANVIGDHLSAARIMEVTDAGRDPIMTGDLLYNPSWSPTLREHVAIAGVIDLLGTGKDQTAEFVRNLEKQGIVVDAYLDIKDLTVKGDGMNWNSNYLIIGAQPEFGSREKIGEGSVQTERKKEVLQKMSDMQNEAKNYGITVLPVRRFLSLIGYKLPRGSSLSTVTDQSFQGGPAKKQPATEEKPAEKPKDDSKDKGM